MMDADAHADGDGVDLGEKPAVLSGNRQAAHHRARSAQSINDAMDIVGGKGICMGPSNFLGAAYMQMPVSITVEGANILTRSLIVFGQGAIRCHPFVLKEIGRDARARRRQGVAIEFDARVHGPPPIRCCGNARARWSSGLTGSHLCGAPANVAPETRRYYQQLHALFGRAGFLADVSMVTLGGALEAQGEAVGAARRRAVAAVPVVGDAQALRGGGPARGGRAADALGGVGRDVQGAERDRRRDLEFPQPLHRGRDAPHRVSARPAVRRCRPIGSATHVARLAHRAFGHA